jgi:hypothetical protein
MSMRAVLRPRFWAVTGSALVLLGFLGAAVYVVRHGAAVPATASVLTETDGVQTPLPGLPTPGLPTTGPDAAVPALLPAEEARAGATPAPGDLEAGRAAPGATPGLQPAGSTGAPAAGLPGGPVASGPAHAPTAVRTVTVPVRTPVQFRGALAAARPGTTISLAPGRYPGPFVLDRAGTAAAPITVTGAPGAMLVGLGAADPVLLLRGADHVVVQGLSIRGGRYGVLLEHTRSARLSRLDVGLTVGAGVVLRAASSNNTLIASSVHDTGVIDPGEGQGVVVGSPVAAGTDASDGNRILDNRISRTTAESVLLREGSSGGTVQGNTMDGSRIGRASGADAWILVGGNGYRIAGNRGQGWEGLQDGMRTTAAAAGWGRRNTFTANNLQLRTRGYGIYVDQKDTTANAVGCDNKIAGAGGLSNLSCS